MILNSLVAALTFIIISWVFRGASPIWIKGGGLFVVTVLLVLGLDPGSNFEAWVSFAVFVGMCIALWGCIFGCEVLLGSAWAKIPRFSLREILLGVLFLAMSLAILSAYFATIPPFDSQAIAWAPLIGVNTIRILSFSAGTIPSLLPNSKAIIIAFIVSPITIGVIICAHCIYGEVVCGTPCPIARMCVMYYGNAALAASVCLSMQGACALAGKVFLRHLAK